MLKSGPMYVFSISAWAELTVVVPNVGRAAYQDQVILYSYPTLGRFISKVIVLLSGERVGLLKEKVCTPLILRHSTLWQG